VQQAAPDILIVDGEHAIHRAIHAYEMLHTSTGLFSGAFYGFLAILKTQIDELQPACTVIVWGHPKSGVQRKQTLVTYKAGRVHDSRLYTQMADDQAFLAAEGWTQYFNDEGWEADDVIATLVHQWEKDYQIVILSGDHDFFQLINANVRCLRPKNGANPPKMFDQQAIVETYEGVPPEHLADLYTLTGDTGDNITGVPGIGKKTAVKLLVDNGPIAGWFNSIDTMYASKRLKEKLLEYKDQMVRNKRLISLKTTNVKVCEIPPNLDSTEAQQLLDKYEVKKFTWEDFLAQ
jgi:DNA polymerase-1